MKYFNFGILFLLVISHAVGQQNHFVYIQTENSQAFYVRISDRLLSSSSSGYVVVPKLQNGTYDLNIGFPKNEWPIQKINLTIKDKDAGYVLKNFDAKGWGLFNMQTMDILMSSSNKAADNASKEDKTDGFADVLADVVSTPSIKQKPIIKETNEELKAVPVIKADPAENTKVTNAKEDIPVAEIMKPAVKLSTTLDNSGRSIIYIDNHDNKTDTVRIFIPYKSIPETPEKPAEKKEEPKAEVKEETVKEKKEEGKFIDMELPDRNNPKDSVTHKPVVEKVAENNSVLKKIETKPVETKTAMVNSDCRGNADEDDFLKLRKKMAAQKTDENMIVMAKKAFVAKCYTTEQVNNLSVLFLKDEGRYNFFDAAYSRVSDTQNFAVLISRLTDEYYINRFKAMIRH